MDFKLPSFLKHFRLLPVMILVASMAFAVRLGEVVVGVKTLSAAAHAAAAAEPASGTDGKTDEKAAAKADEKTDETAAPAPSEATLPVKTDTASTEAPKVDLPTIKEPNIKEGAWHDSTETDIDYSNVPDEIFRDLEKQRAALAKKDSDLQKREALLKAAESEINRKYDELSKLRGDIESLLHKQSEEEEERLKSLVRIYEGMKPKDAARIFNTLDMDVLLEVMGRMSERKSAPIIAEMDPERAQSLTIMLADQKKLPDLPEDAAPTLAPSNTGDAADPNTSAVN